MSRSNTDSWGNFVMYVLHFCLCYFRGWLSVTTSNTFPAYWGTDACRCLRSDRFHRAFTICPSTVERSIARRHYRHAFAQRGTGPWFVPFSTLCFYGRLLSYVCHAHAGHLCTSHQLHQGDMYALLRLFGIGIDT